MTGPVARRSQQSHGQNSKVYVPVLLHVFNEKYRDGDTTVEFTLDDLRAAAQTLGIIGRNFADVIYRMRSRTILPKAVLDKGFYILRAVGRGKYRLEVGENTIFALPDDEVQEALDLTPLPVRRLLPYDIAEIDEQGLLTMCGYCKLLDHFTGLQVYRLRSHVRKSVAGIGQAELDEIDVGVALRDDEQPVIFPIEAKATDEAVNRVQISQMVAFCLEFFPDHEIRPLAIKLDYEGLIHFLEFSAETEPAKLAIVKSSTYRLKMSERQKSLVISSKPVPAAAKPRKVFDDEPVRKSPPTAIDLFSGCGGFSSGMLDAGVAVVAGFDHDKRSIEAFDYNHVYRGAKGYVADLSSVTGSELLKIAGIEKVDLVIGGPPCQPFSIAGKQRGLADKRGNLVFEFVRLVGEIGPSAVVFENVANLESVDNGKVADGVREGLTALGYKIRSSILNAADYGVPQMRRRLFIVGTKGNTEVVFPPPTTHAPVVQDELFERMQPYFSCREAIDSLPDVGDPLAQELHNHEPTIHSASMLEAFAVLSPGSRDKKSYHDRLHPDRPSYTLRAGTGNFSPLRPIHYQYHRVLTVRESARLQGFSDEFIWPDWIPRLQQYRQVGNAVPPRIGEIIARSLAAALGWSLDPNSLRGDPSNRENPNRFTYEERVAARLKRMRGASLGNEPAAESQIASDTKTKGTNKKQDQSFSQNMLLE